MSNLFLKGFTKRKVVRVLVLIVAMISVYGLSVAIAANEVTDLSVSPDPIKLGSTAYLTYTINQDSKVSVTVYKENGELVKLLQNNISRTPGTYSASWTGADNSGNPDGNYKFLVEAKDTTTLAVIGQAEIIKTAASVPAISGVSDTPDPVNPAAGEQATINYTLSKDANVTITILKGFTPVRTITANELKAAGAYSAAWDGKDDGGNLVGDGSYYYQIDAVNPLVPSFKSTTKPTIAVEKEPPQVTGFGSTSSNPFKIGTQNINMGYTLSENASVTLSIYNSSGTLVRALLTNAAKNAGYNSSSWDGKDSSGNYVPEGTYSAVISAVDNFGKNSANQSLSITGGYLPAISNTAVNPNPYSPDGSNPAVISYQVSKDSLVTVQILKNSTVLKTIYNSQYQAAGNYTVAWDGKDDSGTNLTDGSYTCKITAVSPTVPAFSSNSSLPFSIASAPPSITNLTFSQNPFKLGGSSLTIRYDLSENATVSMDVYRGAALVRNLVTNQAKNAGFSLSALWDGKDNYGNYVNEGIYTVVIRGVDVSNLTGEASSSFTAASQPAVANVNHYPEPFNPGNGNLTINYDLSSDARVTVTVLKGFTTLRTLMADSPVSKGSNSIVWDGKDGDGNLIGDAGYSYQIDAVSPTVPTFKTTYKGNVTVDALKAPELTQLGVSPSLVKIGNNATFNYYLNEAATVTAKIYSGEQVVREFPPIFKSSSGLYNFVWDTKDNSGNPLMAGNYLLKLTAVDSSNLTGQAELPFQAEKVPVISAVNAAPAIINMAQSEPSIISFEVSERSSITVTILNSANQTHATLTMGQTVEAGPVSLTWNGTNSNGAPINGTFTYKISAKSISGGLLAQPVSGTIDVINSELTATPPSCTQCHSTYPAAHPVSNCNGCHGGNQPVQNCAGCHSEWTVHTTGSVLESRDCTSCHNSTYSYKIPLHPEDTDSYHLSTTVYQDCQVCHYTSLSKEHRENQTTQKDVNGNFTPQTCFTCHSSTKPAVQQAVTNHQKNCDACHGKGSHNTQHNTSLLDTKCQKCHMGNLTDEHLVNPKTQTDPVTGQLKPWSCGTCHNGSSQSVAGAVYTGNMQCAACHRKAHNMNMVETVPDDLPLFGDFTWGLPVQASIWAGEPWLPDEFKLGGRVLLANRRNGVSGDSVWAFYNTQMQAKGWTISSEVPVPGANFFKVTFTKGTRKALIWFYGGREHTASPVLPNGYRIEILYK